MYSDFTIFDYLNVLQVDNGDDFDDYEFDFKNKIRSILYIQPNPPNPPILVPGPNGAWVPLGPPQNPVGGPNDLVIVAACICVIAAGAVVVSYSIKYIKLLLK